MNPLFIELPLYYVEEEETPTQDDHFMNRIIPISSIEQIHGNYTINVTTLYIRELNSKGMLRMQIYYSNLSYEEIVEMLSSCTVRKRTQTVSQERQITV